MLDLKGGIKQACATIEIVTLQILIESMKERSFEVIYRNGANTCLLTCNF